MRRLSARSHLLGLIAAAVIPVWLFAAYILTQYALNERARFEREALQVARLVSVVVESELENLLAQLKALSKSTALGDGDLEALRAEALRLVEGSGEVVELDGFDGEQIFDTEERARTAPPPPFAGAALADLKAGLPVVSGVYAGPTAGEFRIAVALPVRGPRRESWFLAVTVPTARIHDVLAPAVPAGWTVAIGDRDGAYVARSQMHEEMTGRPGLPEYVAKVVGRAGTFTAHNFQGMTLLAGYYRSDFSDWFYTANVPLSLVQAPLWQSLMAIGAIGLLAMAVSFGLAYRMGKGFTSAAEGLKSRADALGHGRPVTPLSTPVAEFAVIADALMEAEQALADRTHELQAVLETVPAAVWFTYDRQALQVIRNRFAAALMGLSSDLDKHSGAADLVIDTIALKDGDTVSRQDRPLSRAMRGEQTDNEEFAYILPSGIERTLLTSARPIFNNAGDIIGAVQISLDISERKRGEEQRKLLVNELNHRVKNTLAIVQSIASQSLRNATSLADAGRSFNSRLILLAKANDILTRENWSGADLYELIVEALKPHAVLERCRLTGEPVWLPPNLALSLSLAFHELTTNAIKYGALSGEGGAVAIDWQKCEAASGHKVRIEWREEGGPPVKPADRKGFGTSMLERLLDPKSAGTVTIDFDPQGLVCVFQLLLKASVDDTTGRASAGL